MKKWLKWILLAGVLAALLCVTAFAADADQSGIYDVKIVKAGYTLAPAGTASTVTIDGKERNDFYAGAEKLTLTSATAGDGYQIVFVVAGDGSTETTPIIPAAENLYYIDQSAEMAAAVNFNIYPKTLSAGTYSVYIPDSTGLQLIGTFKYYQAYKLGDVDANGKITVGDAGYVLRQVVGDTTLKLSASQLLAADVDGNGKITVGDAGYILRFIVGEKIPYPITN